VVLYESETWSLKLREEYRLRVFESRVLRRIFGGGDCITRSFMTCIIRIIKSRRMRWTGHVKRMGEKRNV
jgi:hypothetical protein